MHSRGADQAQNPPALDAEVRRVSRFGQYSAVSEFFIDEIRPTSIGTSQHAYDGGAGVLDSVPKYGV